MAISFSIETITPVFVDTRIIGDGLSTSVIFSLTDAPFTLLSLGPQFSNIEPSSGEISGYGLSYISSLDSTKKDLTFSFSAPQWQANHSYNGFSVILDSNGHFQINGNSGGTSGAIQPTWSTTSGGTTNDGTLVWTESVGLPLHTFPVSFSIVYLGE